MVLGDVRTRYSLCATLRLIQSSIVSPISDIVCKSMMSFCTITLRVLGPASETKSVSTTAFRLETSRSEFDPRAATAAYSNVEVSK
jgi:hypothetical protein